MSTSSGETRRHPRCPTCRTESRWEGNPNRPFCSLTCRLIDLGQWLDERYRVDADSSWDDSTDPDTAGDDRLGDDPAPRTPRALDPSSRADRVPRVP